MNPLKRFSYTFGHIAEQADERQQRKGAGGRTLRSVLGEKMDPLMVDGVRNGGRP